MTGQLSTLHITASFDIFLDISFLNLNSLLKAYIKQERHALHHKRNINLSVI